MRVNLRRLGFQSQIFRLGSHRGNAVENLDAVSGRRRQAAESRGAEWFSGPPAYAGGYEFRISLPW